VWKAITEEPVTSSEKLRELDLLAYKQLTNEAEADRSPLLLWQQRMLNAFTEGLSNVLPVEVLPLLSGEELRELMCGNPQVDVDLLKQVVEYEGYSATDAVIGYFWQTLTEMTTEERKQFLQFVWARNRLPTRESDFDAPFKIQKDTKSAAALPSASTCFFTLTLPEYSSPEALREKLLFAIRNVTTMETDFQTNSAEIAEGYRSF
jgi:HECT-domain (ubiquitin-transferase)